MGVYVFCVCFCVCYVCLMCLCMCSALLIVVDHDYCIACLASFMCCVIWLSGVLFWFVPWLCLVCLKLLFAYVCVVDVVVGVLFLMLSFVWFEIGLCVRVVMMCVFRSLLFWCVVGDTVFVCYCFLSVLCCLFLFVFCCCCLACCV